MKLCRIYTLTEDIENLLCEIEDILQQIFLLKFHENVTFPCGLDSVLGERGSTELKIDLKTLNYFLSQNQGH